MTRLLRRDYTWCIKNIHSCENNIRKGKNSRYAIHISNAVFLSFLTLESPYEIYAQSRFQKKEKIEYPIPYRFRRNESGSKPSLLLDRRSRAFLVRRERAALGQAGRLGSSVAGATPVNRYQKTRRATEEKPIVAIYAQGAGSERFVGRGTR